jgi:hypothetical protein
VAIGPTDSARLKNRHSTRAHAVLLLKLLIGSLLLKYLGCKLFYQSSNYLSTILSQVLLLQKERFPIKTVEHIFKQWYNGEKVRNLRYLYEPFL